MRFIGFTSPMSWSFENLSKAPMPTASTAQILGNNESFEPYTWPSPVPMLGKICETNIWCKASFTKTTFSQKFGAFLDPAVVICWCFEFVVFSDIQGRTSMFVVSSLVNLFRRGVSGGSKVAWRGVAWYFPWGEPSSAEGSDFGGSLDWGAIWGDAWNISLSTAKGGLRENTNVEPFWTLVM